MLCFVHQYVEDNFFGVKLYHFISIFYLIQKGLNKKISFNSLETCWPIRCENVFLRDFVHLHYLDVYQSEYKVVLFRLPYIHTYIVYCPCVCITVTFTCLPSLSTPTQLIFPRICNLFCVWWHLYILVYILCMILNFLWYDSAVRREHLLMSVCHHCSIYSEALSHHIECCTIIAICSLFTNLLSEYLQILSLFLVRLCWCFYCLERKRITVYVVVRVSTTKTASVLHWRLHFQNHQSFLGGWMVNKLVIRFT